MQAQRHGRLSIIFKSPMAGNESECGRPIVASGRVRFFRPYLGAHSVNRVISGSVATCCLSAGHCATECPDALQEGDASLPFLRGI